jgi:hypothetical protein
VSSSEFCVRNVGHHQGAAKEGLTSNGIVESLLGKVAGLVRRVQDFIVENGEVKGKTKANRVRWCQIGLSNFGGVLISLERLVGGLLSLVANGKLSKITVVITLPFQELVIETSQMKEGANILW